MSRARARVAAFSLGLGLTMSLLVAGPIGASPGGGKPANYGDCVSFVAVGGGGQAAREFTESTATASPAFNPASPTPPGLMDEPIRIICEGFPPGN